MYPNSKHTYIRQIQRTVLNVRSCKRFRLTFLLRSECVGSQAVGECETSSKQPNKNVLASLTRTPTQHTQWLNEFVENVLVCGKMFVGHKCALRRVNAKQQSQKNRKQFEFDNKQYNTAESRSPRSPLCKNVQSNPHIHNIFCVE